MKRQSILGLALVVVMASSANAGFTLVSSEGDTLDPDGVIAPNVTTISILYDGPLPASGAVMLLCFPATHPGQWTGTAQSFDPPVASGTNIYYGVIDFGSGPVDLWYCELQHLREGLAWCGYPCFCADYEFVCTGVGDVTITLYYDDGVSVHDSITIHQVSESVVAPPSADLNGDCFVDFSDFALIGLDWPAADFDDLAAIANLWLTTDPCIPEDMAYIPGGTFAMGDSFGEGNARELPVHTVTVDSFFMGQYEMTNGRYCDYLNSALGRGLITVTSFGVYKAGSTGITGYQYCDTHSTSSDSRIDYNDVTETFRVLTKSGRDMSNDPMVNVTWYGAAAYCNWRSEEEGHERCYDPCDPNWPCDFSKKGYRLATEAEWEYAARGHLSGKRFPWGDTISHSIANYDSLWEEGSPYYAYDVSPTAGFHPTWNDGVEPYTSPVGTFAANGYGLYDMADNVWEWCNDLYDSNYYDYSPTDNPTGPMSGSFRIARGGAWRGDSEHCRIAHRYPANQGFRGSMWGFRIVLDLE